LVIMRPFRPRHTGADQAAYTLTATVPTGVGNFGFGNQGSGNIGIGLSGDHQVGFGGWNSGSGNVGLFNSGDGNIGFFNSGSGNFGIANSGSFNTGIANAGLTNTGWFNSGLANTGWGNAGAYNSGGFNAGAYNTGSFNPGHVNIGWFNTRDTNTGLGNSGNINTGAFVSGDMNNGFFWRGTGQGLIGADYTITIPQIPLTIGGGGILNIPITGAITGLTVQSFTVHGVGSAATPIPVNLHLNVDGESGGATVSVHIPNTDVSFDVHVDGLPITLDLPLDSEVRPIVVPDIPISRIPIVLSLGSDSTSLNTAIGAGIGPISSPFRFSICRRRLASATRPIARRRDSSTRVPGVYRASATSATPSPECGTSAPMPPDCRTMAAASSRVSPTWVAQPLASATPATLAWR
ncbi:PPE family protein, partial [Mycobacterium ulcerans]|nr:PPE family protein [Mycobacterium ulcerans]MEB3925521.1 PPE family protein [Mycobacterium ulcerans]MEB3933807.1 PPE family protein [Mycobacterium ulcerans]MEB3937936.1 PPE family protein [Mycobacterium ulcerans]MEB3958422.1 PPE family protein [Mycobacterium ulcerans]